MRNQIALFAACALLVLSSLVGCGDDDRAGPTDSGVGGDGSDVDSGGRRDGGGRDGGMIADNNDSFDTAATLTLGPDGVSGVINPIGDEDFYTFEATAGDWLLITTEANPDDDPTKVDTVVTLYDATMTQIAENDDSVPRINTDSEIVIHVPATGTYYIKVQEFSTWMAGETPEGGATFTYQLRAGVIDPAADGVVVDPESGNDAASATALELPMNNGFILGTLASATDIDVYSFTIGGAEIGLANIAVMPAGPNGYGSTASIGRAWVTDATGATILARIEYSAARFNLEPSLPAGSYLLWVDHSGTAGSNDFYVAKVFLGMDNPLETQEATNGAVATAEALTVGAPAMGIRSGFILANIGTGDIDYFSFSVMAGEVVTIACGAQFNGSGVTGLTVDLRGSDDSVVQSTMESLTEDLLLQNVAVPAPGTYALRLTKTGQLADVTGDWARCGVHMGPPP